MTTSPYHADIARLAIDLDISHESAARFDLSQAADLDEGLWRRRQREDDALAAAVRAATAERDEAYDDLVDLARDVVSGEGIDVTGFAAWLAWHDGEASVRGKMRNDADACNIDAAPNVRPVLPGGR